MTLKLKICLLGYINRMKNILASDLTDLEKNYEVNELKSYIDKLIIAESDK